MSLKVKLYRNMPAFAKELLTHSYIALRQRREKAAAARMSPHEGTEPEIVYITGFPRSATTMLKYYFSAHPGLQQNPFNPIGFFDSWQKALQSDDILVEKSNHYINSLTPLFAACGRGARVVVVIRDPRDCLVSFAKYQENREVPRTKKYWKYWEQEHTRLLDFAYGSPFADGLFLLRYEDLVSFPREAKSAFLNWMGIETDPDQLDLKYRNEHPEEGWHDSVHDYKEVGKHALQKWKSVGALPPWCVTRLAEQNNHQAVIAMMQKFGYTDEGFGPPNLATGAFTFYQPDEAT
jgi:hypothetical protein